MTQYLVYKRFMTNEPNKYNNYSVDWKSINTKLQVHEDIHGRSGSLPAKSTPNSSKDLYVNNELQQRRYYDSSGNCIKDIDYFHTGDKTHAFPHEHYWQWKNNRPIRSQKGYKKYMIKKQY